MFKTIISFFRRIFGLMKKHEIIVNTIPVIPPVKIPPQVPTKPVPPETTMPKFPVILLGDLTCDDDETVMVREAYFDLEKVLMTESFKKKVLAAEFTETNELTNQQIYDSFVTNSPIKVNFSMFSGTYMQNRIWGTIGFEDPDYPDTCFANRYFIKDKETCASLILHESAHCLGFTHYDVMATSVPYQLNDIYSKVAQELGLEA